jgi:hypothetical protein
MSYSGGDGQTLGIVLTPAHICELFCYLLDIQPDDIVLEKTLTALIQTNDTTKKAKKTKQLAA